MKPLKELARMLVLELGSHVDRIAEVDKRLTYYNELLGDTSFLLAGGLELLLKKDRADWDKSKWIDDSLITSMTMQDDRLKLAGIMIWGTENTTAQWTDPFDFELELPKDSKSFTRFTLRFCDRDRSEVTYEDFRSNRGYWSYRIDNWKYVLNYDFLNS